MTDLTQAMGVNPGPARQLELYFGGLGGDKPSVPVDVDILEARAAEVLSPEAYSYIACGAGRESTVDRNRTAFDRWAIVPRMLNDVSTRHSGIDLLGMAMPAPLMLAPIGVQDLAHPEGDLATARAAAALGVPMIFSNQASVAMEVCAEAMGDAPRLFQLYWSRSREIVASLVRRSEACGCKAIIVTLDTTMLGWRTRDLDLAHLPFLHGLGIAQYVSDPVFREGLRAPPEEDIGPSVEKFLTTYSNPALTWSDLSFLREHTSLPILLKGILHADDARRAIDEGMDGIVVSNHGGRQVDGAIAAIEALPDVARAVDGRIPVLFDSGIRGGQDMFKALALGASAACLGRPYLYGLALAGQAGVEAVVRSLIADFDLTMGLAGVPNVARITTACVMDRYPATDTLPKERFP